MGTGSTLASKRKKALHALCNACGTQFKFDGGTTSQLDQHEKTNKHKNSMKTYSKHRNFTLGKGNTMEIDRPAEIGYTSSEL